MRELCVEGLAMSTRVALPMHVGCRMSELRRQLLPSPTPSQDRTALVRKNLFGPIDHDENIKFVQDELDKISQADCQRWNFDFQSEKPKEGRYNWEPVAEGVPQAYEMSRLTYLTTHATTSPHTTLAAPTPVRKVPEGGGTSTTTTTTAVDQPSTSTQTTTTTPTSTTISTTTTTTTTTVLDKAASQTTTRLPTSVSSASPTSASEAATSKSIREVVVKKYIGDTEKLDTREHKPLSVLRCTRSRSSQPPLTAYMKIHKSKRPASSKLEEEQPPALVKRPRTSSS